MQARETLSAWADRDHDVIAIRMESAVQMGEEGAQLCELLDSYLEQCTSVMEYARRQLAACEVLEGVLPWLGATPSQPVVLQDDIPREEECSEDHSQSEEAEDEVDEPEAMDCDCTPDRCSYGIPIRGTKVTCSLVWNDEEFLKLFPSVQSSWDWHEIEYLRLYKAWDDAMGHRCHEHQGFDAPVE
jgi:hypothetical protein